MSTCSFDATTGKLHVDGLNIVQWGERPQAKLSAGDFAFRDTTWIRQITIHTTGGHWPQPIKPGAGAGGLAANVGVHWQKDPEHSGAHIVIDTNGDVWVMCNLMKHAAYHATTVNDWSIGIEMCTLHDGSIYQATLDACVKLVMALCDLFGIPFQTTSRIYKSNTLVSRMKDGGKYVVGVFGHRDNAWKFPWQLDKAVRAKYPNGYASRGQGDPGDAIYTLCRRAGAMNLDFEKLGDLAYWKPVQRAYNVKYGYKLDEDGICGPDMVRVLRKHGMWNNGVFLEAPFPIS